MKIQVGFSLDHSSTYKPANFETVEQKERYVKAELSDPICIDKYNNLAAATNKKERDEAKKRLDFARYNFFKRWTEKTIVPIRPIDFPPDIGA